MIDTIIVEPHEEPNYDRIAVSELDDLTLFFMYNYITSSNMQHVSNILLRAYAEHKNKYSATQVFDHLCNFAGFVTPTQIKKLYDNVSIKYKNILKEELLAHYSD